MIKKILFSLSWYIFIHELINLNIEKWLPISVDVMLLKECIENQTFFFI